MSVNAANTRKAVALLARPGEARERLRAALIEAGATIVLDQDPLQTTRESLTLSAPSAVVMVLEPAVEDCLDELDQAFQTVGAAVIYEEADVVARRAGWEAQRWGRHLIAKLYGHNDVLPPGSENDSLFQPEPGRPATPQQLAVDAPWEPHLSEARERAVDLPEDGLKPFDPETDVFGRNRWAADVYEFEAESGLQVGMETEAAVALAEDRPASSPFAIVLDESVTEEKGAEDTPEPAGMAIPSWETGMGEFAIPAEMATPAPEPAGLDLSLEPVEARQSDFAPLPDPVADFAPDAFAPMEPEPTGAESLPSASEYAPPPVAEASPLSEMSLSLVDIEPTADPSERVPGAVLVMAGIGGPDAVRRLLSELPPDFPRPVLVQLRLDGGRYDNLVKQLARASGLPVELAKLGDRLQRSVAYVLPEDVSVHFGAGVAHFVAPDIGEDVIATLPPAESGVLMLSGSDPMRVELSLALGARGGYLAGQVVEGCYDPVAVNLLAAEGVELGTPSQLATELIQRWIE